MENRRGRDPSRRSRPIYATAPFLLACCPSSLVVLKESRSPSSFLNNQICFAATGLNPRDRRSKHISLPVRFFLPLISLSSEAEGQAFSVFLSGKHFSSKEVTVPSSPGWHCYPFQGPLGWTQGTKRI